uniref:Coronin n=1 Tax=Aplanochytrium stocchinoi TaxID=215587 RepID=A0A7S3PPJ2_9STRA
MVNKRATLVRQSKVRHLFCKQSKPENSYTNIQTSPLSGFHHFIQASTKFLAYSARHGVAVVPHGAFGKSAAQPLIIDGHQNHTLAFEFSPFYDNVLVTGGGDTKCEICLWAFPEEGLYENLHETDATYTGHTRNVDCLAMNHVVDAVLASGSKDKTVKTWNLETGQIQLDVDDFGGPICDLKWNYDGNIICASSKAKSVRFIDPRTGDVIDSLDEPFESMGHGTRISYLGNTGQVAMCGKDKERRILKIFDIRALKEPVGSTEIDRGSGQLMMLFDEGVNVIYVASKGSNTIKYYEATPDFPHVHHIDDFRAPAQTVGICMLPKRAVNVAECEVTAMLQLTREAIVPSSFIVPRKSPMFQGDLYPACFAGKPAMSAKDYFEGEQVIDIHAKGNDVKKKTRFVSKKPIYMKMDKLHKGEAVSRMKNGVAGPSDPELVSANEKNSDDPGFSKLRNALRKTVLTPEEKLQKAEERIQKLEAKLESMGVDPATI